MLYLSSAIKVIGFRQLQRHGLELYETMWVAPWRFPMVIVNFHEYGNRLMKKVRGFLIILLVYYSLGESFAHVIYKDLLADNLDNAGQFYGYLYNNYGWIDGADTAPNDIYPLGNTHNVYWARFYLPAESHVSLRVESVKALPSNPNGSYRMDLAPAFTLYSGLAPFLGHDGANPECIVDGAVCHGVLKVLDSFTLWNSKGQNARLEYLGHAASNADQPRFATGIFNSLPAGHYTLLVGGGNPKGIPDGVGMPYGVRPFSVSTAIVPKENGPTAPSLVKQRLFSGGLPANQAQKRYSVRCGSYTGSKTQRYWFAVSSHNPGAPKLRLTVKKNGETRAVVDPNSGDLAFSSWSSVGKGNGTYELAVSREPDSGGAIQPMHSFIIRHACGANDGQLTYTALPRELE